MLIVFLFALYLFANVFCPWFQINRLLLEDDAVSDNLSSEYQSIITEFRAFLSDSKDVLDEATTMKLLERYFLFVNFFISYSFAYPLVIFEGNVWLSLL